MAAALDRTLKIKLFLSDYIPFNLKEGRIFKFSLFRFPDEELGLEYFFIPNTSNFEVPTDFGVSAQPNAIGTNANVEQNNDLFAGLDVDQSIKLIKELPKTDYFLILKGEDLHTHQYKIIDKLKTLSEIIQIQAIEPQDLPSRRNLIF